ncbi:MAG: GNAT family N-acetyltransferase [Gemmatimonadaceae bacterium]
MNLSLRAANNSDQEFAFLVKRAALGSYVEQVWGWNDDFQRRFHASDWTSHRPDIITCDAEAIGTLEVVRHSDHLYVGAFYLLPAWQRRGVGSRLLQDVVERGFRERLPIRLQFLKINPVRSLYERHGFRITGETLTHFLAECPRSDSTAPIARAFDIT